MTVLEIGSRTIGRGHPAFVIAEVAQAHDGSLGMAHAFIDAVADVGVDAVKFQTHIAAAESTLDEPFRVAASTQDSSRYDYWRRMEFTPEQWQGLARHADKRGIIFLSSAFSQPAVQLLQRIGMLAWKVGSGEFRSRVLMEVMAATHTPILLSTGMASRAEIAEAVGYLKSMNATYALLQCTSAYPTALEQVGLNIIDDLRAEFGCPVGLSDHSGKIYPGLAALARGAEILEVHVTFDRRMFGPDICASVTVEELQVLCEMRDAVTILDTHPVDKDVISEQLRSLRDLFGKSVAPLRALPAGTVLTPDLLTTKKPGYGIPADALGRLAGRKLARDVVPNRILRWNDVEE